MVQVTLGVKQKYSGIRKLGPPQPRRKTIAIQATSRREPGSRPGVVVLFGDVVLRGGAAVQGIEDGRPAGGVGVQAVGKSRIGVFEIIR